MHVNVADGVAVRYTDIVPAGPESRQPVLLLHGFGSNFHMNWERTGWSRALASRGARVLGPDLRGHGASGKPLEDEAYLPEVFAADLELLLDGAGIERADILAYSMGSRLAWEFALTRPERVRRAVLAGFGPADAFAGVDLHDLESDPHPFAEVYRAVAALPGNDPRALAACARGQAARPFRAEPAPEGVPLLFAAGEKDALAAGAAELAAGCGADHVSVPHRDHANAVSARALKQAVADFLGG